MFFKKVFEIPYSQAEKCPNQAAMSSYNGQEWKIYSSDQMLHEIQRFRSMLHEFGLRKGDYIVMVPAAAQAEWIFLDMAAQESGIIVVAVHDTILMAHSEYMQESIPAKYWFFRDAENIRTVLPNGPANSNLKTIALFGPADENHLSHFLPKETLKLPIPDIDESDTATIIYTSGTTGRPKGVMLTHKNIVSNVNAVLPLIPLEAGEHVLSFLPYSHIFERAVIFGYLAGGFSIFLPGPGYEPAKAFAAAQPVLFTSVPRILEKMYDEILKARSKSPKVMQWILDWAIRFGGKFEPQMAYNPLKWLPVLFIRHIIFRSLRMKLGGRLKYIFVGAAYLQPRLARLFMAAGIEVREGYGLTETSPAITINRYGAGPYRINTVGLPIKGVEVKLENVDEDGAGEILIKGPNVMKGYYMLPKETQAVFTEDGWFRTGDVGRYIDGKFLQITDRAKDIFKTSSGKYIAPIALENHFLHSPYIDQIMVIGFQKPYVTALIVPQFDLLKNWCEANGIHWTSPQYMVINIKVKAHFQAEIDRINSKLPRYQQVRNFYICPTAWTHESGLLTHTLKLIRSRIEHHFEKEVEEMYK